MNLAKAEQAIVNGIYAAAAWLILDLGLLFQEHGVQTFSVLLSRPEMAVGAFIVIACIAGLFYKSRVAAITLFLLFLVPMILKAIQGTFPSTIFFVFSLILLYFFFAAVLGTFSYHHLKSADQDRDNSD